jgi:hypothetical protein
MRLGYFVRIHISLPLAALDNVLAGRGDQGVGGESRKSAQATRRPPTSRSSLGPTMHQAGAS